MAVSGSEPSIEVSCMSIRENGLVHPGERPLRQFGHRLFEDREGNIWVATMDGVDRFRDVAVRTVSANQGYRAAPLGPCSRHGRAACGWAAMVA